MNPCAILNTDLYGVVVPVILEGLREDIKVLQT